MLFTVFYCFDFYDASPKPLAPLGLYGLLRPFDEIQTFGDQGSQKGVLTS